MLHEWINPTYLSSSDSFKHLFTNNKPFPHLVLHHFFHQEKAEMLRKTLLQEKWLAHDTDLFRFHHTSDLQSSSQRFMKEWYGFFNSRMLIDFISSITGISPLKNIDAAGQRYRDGDYLLPHDDRLEGRKIAYVINLTKQFTSKNGGQLDFF